MPTELMTTDVSPLTTHEDLLALEKLQIDILGPQGSRSVLSPAILAGLREGGGLLLGAWSGLERSSLVGALVDVSGRHQGFEALFSLFCGVDYAVRYHGVGYQLRRAERLIAQRDQFEVVRWWVDPLRSDESHFAFNKLGAIAVRYERNALGELTDRPNAGLATDRLGVEWWVNAPRVQRLMDRHAAPDHTRLGLHRMTVVTKTGVGPSGQRVLSAVDPESEGDYLLVEIPADLERLRDADPAEARTWRLRTREVFEQLFASGYVVAGLIHEAGRSFQLLEATGRGAVLGRA